MIAAQAAAACRLWHGLEGWRRPVASLGLGAVSLLAMPPFGLWPILALTLPALTLLLDGCSRLGDIRERISAAAMVGWCFGFGYLLPGLYWVGSAFLVEADKFAWLMPFAVTLLPAYLAVYFAMAGAAAIVVWRSRPERVLLLAVSLAIAEWLRGHLFTGFPWNALGYALTIDGNIAQAASLVGVTSLTFWTVLLLASPVVLLPDAAGERPKERSWLLPAAALVVLVTMAAWGAHRLASGPTGDVPGVHLRIVQPDTPEAEKFVPGSQRRIFDAIKGLSRPAVAQSLAGSDRSVIIWPETPLNFLLLQSPEALAEISSLLQPDSVLLTGVIRREADPADPARVRFFNSLVAIGASGEVLATYDKRHLVPFGEYLPWQGFLGAIGLENLTRTQGGFQLGANPRWLTAPGVPAFSPLICYEAIFPGEVVESGERPQWLLNVTNDAWFGVSTGPYQHFHQTRVRAIEEGLPVVRAANTGISAVVDAYGRVRQKISLETAGGLDSGLPIALPSTPYSRYGDVWLLIHTMIGGSVYWLLVAARSRPARRSSI